PSSLCPPVHWPPPPRDGPVASYQPCPLVSTHCAALLQINVDSARQLCHNEGEPASAGRRLRLRRSSTIAVLTRWGATAVAAQCSGERVHSPMRWHDAKFGKAVQVLDDVAVVG